MTADLPLGHEFEPPTGVAMTDPASDECAHRAHEIGTVCARPEGAHEARSAWAYDPNVVSWDWKAQPDMDALADLLAPLGVTLTTIDTGCDEYAVRVAAAEGPAKGPSVHAERPGADPGSTDRTGVPETLSEAQACEWPDVDGWSLHSRPGGMLLSHDTDADMPTLWSDGPMQLGAVLAFIADQEGPTDEH